MPALAGIVIYFGTCRRALTLLDLITCTDKWSLATERAIEVMEGGGVCLLCRQGNGEALSATGVVPREQPPTAFSHAMVITFTLSGLCQGLLIK